MIDPTPRAIFMTIGLVTAEIHCLKILHKNISRSLTNNQYIEDFKLIRLDLLIASVINR